MAINTAKNAEDPVLQWVTFRLEGETYGINVMQVQEVLRYTEIAPVPGAPSYVLGIINLRGANPGLHWYDKEVAEANLLGIRHIDFRMSARRELSRAQAVELIGLMAKAAKPILIHCASGSDRTGLASALYLASIAKLGEEASEGQLSLRFGHLSLPFAPGYAMDRTFEDLEPYFGFPNS